MINFLPIENLVFKTYLSKEQAMLKLKDNLEIENSYVSNASKNSGSKPYHGKFSENRFEIRRIVSYMNSFLPLIKGEIYSEIDSTRIKLNMALHKFVLIFMSIWLGFVMLILIATLYAYFFNNATPTFHFPLLMFVLGYTISVGSFKFEASKSKKDLLKIFEAEIE